MRDYVRTSPAKRKPNSRTNNRRPTRGGGNNHDLPVIKIAVAIAILLGFAFFLYRISGSSGETDPVTTGKIEQENKPIPIEQQRPGKEPFDYMQILQNKEVPVTLPDGEVIADPSKDPQLLAHQQKMQEQLQAQQERAKQLALQQNGQLPQVTDSASVQTSSIQSVSSNTGTTENKADTSKLKTEDPRKPRSFAEIIASESTKKKVNESRDLQSKAEKDRQEALAMFGKPQAYASNTASKAPVSDISSSSNNKRFIMQCGAFRTDAQANTLRSRLSTQGQSAQIKQVNSASGVRNNFV